MQSKLAERMQRRAMKEHFEENRGKIKRIEA
jgi:hypothetical protein